MERKPRKLPSMRSMLLDWYGPLPQKCKLFRAFVIVNHAEGAAVAARFGLRPDELPAPLPNTKVAACTA